MISRKAKYAIRSALFLARHYGNGPVSVKKIAAAEGISRKFLETIMRELTNGGLFCSFHGKLGGYTLKLPPDKVTIGRIIRLIDGTLSPVACVSATAYAPCPDCPSERDCHIRLVMKNVGEAISRVLDIKTLDQLMRDVDNETAVSREILFDI